MGVQTFYGKRPQKLQSGGSQATSGKIISGLLNGLNDCVIFTVYTKFTNVAATHTIQLPGMRVR
jgi:hypothetical protein